MLKIYVPFPEGETETQGEDGRRPRWHNQQACELRLLCLRHTATTTGVSVEVLISKKQSMATVKGGWAVKNENMAPKHRRAFCRRHGLHAVERLQGDNNWKLLCSRLMKKAQEGRMYPLSFPAVSQWRQCRNRGKEGLSAFWGAFPRY